MQSGSKHFNKQTEEVLNGTARKLVRENLLLAGISGAAQSEGAGKRHKSQHLKVPQQRHHCMHRARACCNACLCEQLSGWSLAAQGILGLGFRFQTQPNS
jgi:hypothetical protein